LYTTFRNQFLVNAQKKNLDVVSFEHQELGPKGEKLFTDYALFPGEKNSGLPTLIHLSGLHGVEGYFGSLLQQKILESFDFSTARSPIIFVHAVNPYGMAWFRRTNPENVDLNRNCWQSDHPIYNSDFLKFEKFFSALEGHHIFQQAFQFAKLLPLISRQGLKKTTEIITGGQSVSPQSIFYAGEELQSELQNLIAQLQRITKQTDSLRVIDVHTGLGSYAHESLIVDGFDSAGDVKFWSQSLGGAPIIDPATDPKIYRADGALPLLIKRHWPETHFIVQEFGTYSGFQVLQTLVREEPEQTLHTFFPSDLKWQQACLQKGLLRFNQLAQAMKTK